jgi:predicted SAM-dependent methyltransferase
LNYLNIGCGSVFDPVWNNIDSNHDSVLVKSYDIRRGLPFDDHCLDVCYSSHVIEHLTQDEARKLLKDCWRVLKSEGIIRLVVPDLEAIARNYLLALEQVVVGELNEEANYDWMMLELYDQTVRNYSGGEMGKYLSNPNITNRDFTLSRMGYEAENHWQKEKNGLNTSNLLTKLKSKSLSWLIKKSRIEIAKLFVFLIAGKEGSKAFEEGVFRASGEVHQWMYDRFSLQRMLDQCGFVDIRICRADQSSIPDFSSYGLDIIEGKVRKPDSLFIEAFKP